MSIVSHLPDSAKGRITSFLVPMFFLFWALPTLYVHAQVPETELDREMSAEEVYQAYLDLVQGAHARDDGGLVGESPIGRHQWFMFQRSYPLPYLPAGIRQSAIAGMKKMESRLADAAQRLSEKGVEAAAEPERWENIGPFNIAGRVRAIIVHPTEPSTIFIGAATGGVWKNVGDPNVWTTTFDTNSALSIGSLAFDPNNANIIYAGTGEVISGYTSQFNSTPAYFGDGVFKSTDQGVTWRNIGLRQLGNVSDIWVMKGNSDVVYVSSSNGTGGLYKSTDGGESWVQQTGLGQYFGEAIFNVEVSPANEDHILISGGNRIFFSRDGGETFTRATGFSPQSGARTEIAIAPSNPDRVYALVARRIRTSVNDDREDIGEAYVSDDGGASFVKVFEFPERFFNQQGTYNNCIRVHPTNSDIALFGGIDIYRTTNGGGTFSNTTLSYAGGNVHPDQHVVTFSQSIPNRVYLGNDGGVYVSNDAGANWDRISEALPISQFYELGIDQSRPYRVYGGTQDNGSLGAFGENGWAKNWIRILGGDGFHTVVDPSVPNFVYAESQYGRTSRVTVTDPDDIRPRYISRTPDRADPGPWSTPLAIGESTGALYTGRSFMWRTLDRGNNWDQLDSNSRNRGAQISAIATGTLEEGDVMYGTATGQLFFSFNGGDDWRVGDSTNVIPSRYVSEILYDPIKSDRVYVVISGALAGGNVFRSDDRGLTFVNVSGTLPNIPTSGFAIDPENNNILFAGNDIGVYVSLDGGEVWLPFNNGFPVVPVTDLEIHKSKRTLIAGTHGRSMFEISIDNPQPVPIIVSPFGGESYFSDDTIKVSWAGFQETVRLMISYNGGQTWDTLGEYSQASGTSLVAPPVISENVLVRVESLDGARSAESNPFEITLLVNTDGRGSRGFKAGAVEARESKLWVADRENPQFYLLTLPILAPSSTRVEHTFDHTRLVDLAYNSQDDIFYVLLADTLDYSGAELWTMSPEGETGTQLPLPATAVSGVSYGPDGLAIITPGNNGVGYLLNDETGEVVRETGPLDVGSGTRRVGLTFDGTDYTQVVEDFYPNGIVTDALQRIGFRGNARVEQSVPLVVENSEQIDAFGIVAQFDLEGDDSEVKYYVTSTAGRFYIITIDRVSSVRTIRAVNSSLSIANVSPNPSTGQATLTYRVDRSGEISVDIYDNRGNLMLNQIRTRAEQGESTVQLDLSTLPSGLYRAVLTAENGDRAMATVMVMK